MINKAAIYCRISDDKTGISAGVDRQEADCRALAKRLGLTVTHVLVDNSISAYSGKPRPQYKRLLELMKQSEIGTVLAFHQDRLQRSPLELEEYVDVSEAGSVTTHTVLAGHIDLSTPSGRFNARIIGAAARYEVEHMIERQRAAKLDAAKKGKFLGGQRPFGFEPRREAIRESEASLIREMAGRVIEGESFNSIAVDLSKRGIKTQHGKTWKAVNIYNVLRRPINTAIVEHKGVQYDSDLPAILSRDDWDALMAAMEHRAEVRPHRTRFRKHVLNGLLYCGKCRSRLTHKSKMQRDGSIKPQVVCMSSDGVTGQRTGCGGVTRMVDPIIALVSDAVIYRLDSPDLVKELRSNKKDSETARNLFARQRRLKSRLTELNDDYYLRGELKRTEYDRLKLAATTELSEVETAIQQTARSAKLPNISLAGDIEKVWQEASLEWKRDVMFQLIDQVIVHPVPRVPGYYPPIFKEWRFDPQFIDIKWRI